MNLMAMQMEFLPAVKSRSFPKGKTSFQEILLSD
jgi:hypothetical protein